MVEAYQRRSALAHFGLSALATQNADATTGIVVGEIAHRAIINIRGDAADPAFVAAVRSVLRSRRGHRSRPPCCQRRLCSPK